MTIYSLIREAESALSSAPEHLQNSSAASALRVALQRLDDLSQVFVDKYSRLEAAKRVAHALQLFTRALHSAPAAPRVRIYA